MSSPSGSVIRLADLLLHFEMLSPTPFAVTPLLLPCAKEENYSYFVSHFVFERV